MTNTTPSYWPDADSDEYGAAAETAISLIASAGYGYDDRDNAGQPVNEDLQSALMDVMFRSQGVAEIISHAASIAETAVIRHNSKMNSQL